MQVDLHLDDLLLLVVGALAHKVVRVFLEHAAIDAFARIPAPLHQLFKLLTVLQVSVFLGNDELVDQFFSDFPTKKTVIYPGFVSYLLSNLGKFAALEGLQDGCLVTQDKLLAPLDDAGPVVAQNGLFMAASIYLVAKAVLHTVHALSPHHRFVKEALAQSVLLNKVLQNCSRPVSLRSMHRSNLRSRALHDRL